MAVSFIKKLWVLLRRIKLFAMVNFYINLYRLILWRRYKVILKGDEILTSSCPKLILPNHISHIDPQIISIITHQHTDFVPLVAERFFKVPVVKYFLRHLHAVKVPDLSKGRGNLHLAQAINNNLLEAFKAEKSAIIFPSGQLSTGGLERIYNKQSAYKLVQSLPDDVQIVGVRIRGMWGSMWSKAWNGKRPVFLSTYLVNIVLFFSNLIFFCPRRKVHIEFVDISSEARLQAVKNRKSFNAYLEKFYNRHGSEEPTFVRHLFFFPRTRYRIKTATIAS